MHAVLGRLAAVAVVLLASACAILPSDGRGTEACLGCRTTRDVVVSFGISSSTARTPSSNTAWILEQVPDHEHHYVRTGCWISGSTISTLASRMPCSGDDWVTFLRSRDPAAVPEYVTRSLDPGDWRLREEIYLWRVARDPAAAQPGHEAYFERMRAEAAERDA